LAVLVVQPVQSAPSARVRRTSRNFGDFMWCVN
jgi:hypothetical protein